MINATPVARSGPVVASADQPDRRTFLAQAAAVSLLGRGAAQAGADPIFAAIEAHRQAVGAARDAVEQHHQLDLALPADKCRSHVRAWQEEIVLTDDPLVLTDDPRWIACERALCAAFDVETDAACALLNVLPTTLAGVIALLQYAVSANIDGHTWPDDLTNTDKVIRSWHHFLVANLAKILPGMVTT